jgi:hypothetical protein
MLPSEFLAAWESRWGELSGELRLRFLDRAEVLVSWKAEAP